MAALLLDPLSQALNDGATASLSGAKLFVYDAGTTDNAAVYTDAAESVQHPQPIVADAAGRFANIFAPAGQSYKVVLKTSADVTVITRDDIPPGIANDGSTLPVSSGGTGAITAAAARTNLGAASASDLTTTTGNVSTLQSGQNTSDWVAGTSTTKTAIGPDQLKEAARSHSPEQPNLLLTQELSSGTGGGDFIADYFDRALNTSYPADPDDGITGASLSSPNFTLPTGTYYAKARSYAGGGFITFLEIYNVTAATRLVVGETDYQFTSSSGFVELEREFVLTGSTVLKLRHYTSRGALATSTAFGSPSSLGTEQYASLAIWKTA